MYACCGVLTIDCCDYVLGIISHSGMMLPRCYLVNREDTCVNIHICESPPYLSVFLDNRDIRFIKFLQEMHALHGQ